MDKIFKAIYKISSKSKLSNNDIRALELLKGTLQMCLIKDTMIINDYIDLFKKTELKVLSHTEKIKLKRLEKSLEEKIN